MEGKEEVSSEAGEGEEVELALKSELLDKNNDPVRMYLREMGSVPQLKRQGEVAIAKRIERGELLVLKAISRSPIVIKELLATGEELRTGRQSIKKIVQFDQEELTEEEIENQTRATLRVLDKIEKFYHLAQQQAIRLERAPKSKKRVHLRARRQLARTRIADIATGSLDRIQSR